RRRHRLTMKIASAIALVAVALVAPDAGSDPSGGTVTGNVLVREKGNPATRDEIWVYLEPLKPRRRRNPAAALPAREIRQEKVQFSPHVLVVPVGTSVAFP